MSVRQEKFAGLLQQHLSDLFLKHKDWINNQFVTISRVDVSPDLGYAKIYLSMFKVRNREELLNLINFNGKEIRKHLAAKIKNQARVVPELNFFIDETLDYVFKMEEVLKNVREQDEKRNQQHD
ncbi:MAG: ribosome-binding factor A [Bacteroidia bacterium]